MLIEWAHYQRNKPTQSKRRTKVFISEPDPAVRQRFGRLFGVLELQSLQPTHLRFLHALIEELERAYYPTVVPHGPSMPIANHFEAMLRTMRSKFQKLAESHDISIEGSVLSLLIGVLKERDLVFTHCGTTRLFLLHREEQRAPKLIDIIALSENGEKQDVQCFASFLEGQLGEHDALLVATEPLVDLLSLPQLQEILTQSTPKECVEQLEELLDDAPPHLAFPLLVVGLSPEHSRERASAASLSKLLNTARATEQTLSPSVRNDIRRMASGVFFWIRNLIPKRRPQNTEDEQTPTTPSHAIPTRTAHERLRTIGTLVLRSARILGRLLLQLIATLLILIARAARWVLMMLMYIRGSRDGRGTHSAPKTLGEWKSWIGGMPLKHRVSFFLGIVLLVIFAGSIVVLSVQRSIARGEAEFQSIVKTIEEKRAQLEVNLIYRDEDRAKQTLQELNTLLTSIPTNRTARRLKKQELEQIVATLRARVNKNTILDTPERVVDLATFAPDDRTLDLKAFVLQDNNLYVYGDDPLLFKVNLQNTQAISFEIPKTNIGRITAAIAATKGTILLVDDQNRLIELNPEARTLKPVDITLNADAAIRAGAFYNDRLYLIDGKNQQIVRHQKTATGLGKGAEWLKESVNLTDAQDLVIDGSLWVLFTDGSIAHLVQGKRRALTLASIEPQLTRASRISTTFESKFLTLLDPAAKRIIVFNKQDGKLAMQYSSPIFDNLKDFFVDEGRKIMYIMNGTTIYKVPLQHL